MSIFLRHNKTIILIAGFALLLRIGFFMVVQPWDKQVLQETILVGDPDGYHNMALSIINSGSFSYHKYMPFEKIKGDVSAERTPGYPLFVSFVYFLFGVRPWLVILFQLLVNVGSLILIYVLAKKVFEKKIAIIAALLYAIEPHAISLPIAFMTDTLFTFTFLASMLIFFYGIENNRIYSKIAKEYYRAHWKFYIPQHIVKGAIRMFLSPGTTRIANRLGLESEAMIRLFFGIFLAVNYLAFFFGSVLMIYRRNYNFLIVILFVFLYFVAVIGPLGIVRFKVPLTPFNIIVGASGIFEIFHLTRAYVGTALDKKRHKLDF
jgi:hypothetical protein